MCGCQEFVERFIVLTFRLLDDIKESVRKAASATMRALNSTILKLCDPSVTAPSDVAGMVQLVVRACPCLASCRAA